MNVAVKNDNSETKLIKKTIDIDKEMNIWIEVQGFSFTNIVRSSLEFGYNHIESAKKILNDEKFKQQIPSEENRKKKSVDIENRFHIHLKKELDSKFSDYIRTFLNFFKAQNLGLKESFNKYLKS